MQAARATVHEFCWSGNCRGLTCISKGHVQHNVTELYKLFSWENGSCVVNTYKMYSIQMQAQPYICTHVVSHFSLECFITNNADNALESIANISTFFFLMVAAIAIIFTCGSWWVLQSQRQLSVNTCHSINEHNCAIASMMLYSLSGIFFRCQNCKYNSCQQNYIASQFPNFENCISSATGGLLQSHWTGHLFVPRRYCEQPDCLQWQAEQLQLGWDQNSTEYAIHPQVVSHYKRSLSLTCHSERIYNTSLLYLHLSGVIRVIL